MAKSFLVGIDAAAGISVSGGNVTVSSGYFDLSKNELRNARVQNLGTNPATNDSVAGQIYYHTGTNTLRYFDGAAWQSVANGNSLTFGSPSALTVGGANADGSSLSAARSDHVHALPGWGSPTSVTSYGQTAQDGTATTFARSDHTHGTPAHGATEHASIKLSDLAAPAANLAMGEFKLTGLAAGSGAGDSVRYEQVLLLAGGTMSGAIAMGTNKITGLGNGASSTDALAYGQVLASSTTLISGLFSSTNPVMDGTASVGTSAQPARSDHTHPSDTSKLSLSGGTMTGTLTMSGATIAMGNSKITGLADGTNAADAVTKSQMDAAIQTSASGLDVKQSVRAATTANITLSGTQTIDGVSVIAGDRVLVKNQNTASTNGIYVVAASTWSRATDFDTDAEVTPNAFTFVEEGTTLADTGWVLSTNGPITVDTTGLTFTQFSGQGQYTAGDGLTLTGTTFAVGTGTGIAVTADAVAVDRSTNGGKVALIYATTIGDGTNTDYTVTHDLGSKDVGVTIYDNSTNAEVITDVIHSTTNTITVSFAAAPASNKYRVVVFG